MSEKKATDKPCGDVHLTGENDVKIAYMADGAKINVYGSEFSRPQIDIAAILNSAKQKLKDTSSGLFLIAESNSLFLWLDKVFTGMGDLTGYILWQNATEQLCFVYYLTSSLRCCVDSSFAEGRTCDLAEYTDILDGMNLGIRTDAFLSLITNSSLEELAKQSNEMFYRFDEKIRAVISFATLSIFFTDLYLILSRYADSYHDMIKYKTNAKLDISNFSKYIPPQHININVDLNKRRVDVSMICSDADSHKAAALFVNEFERAISGFEDVFSHIGFQVYYVRARIMAFDSDNVSNHNFEAYTPTLMPLLAGGHLYPTNYVFARELVQNAIDSVVIRETMGGTLYSGDIKIQLALSGEKDSISTFTITDNGIGMGRIEIERYLTSIGRSFYTANDFKKLKIAYKPIGTFGIGFLTCFLVSNSISIRTHKKDVADESCELSIPNIEGCFFVEKSSSNFDIGTEVLININYKSKDAISLTTLIEYLDSHFLDIRYDINIAWDKLGIGIQTLYLNEQTFDIRNTEIEGLVRSQIKKAPSTYGFTSKGIIVERGKARTFCCDWWNKYFGKDKLGGIILREGNEMIKCFSIQKHKTRTIGDKFFIFIPLGEDGTVPQVLCNTIESTYQFPYGIFITDVPVAGTIIMNENNGRSPCSGRLVFMNAGILIDEAELKPLFGFDMRIYSQNTETAYNNVFINLPPNWVELNVARDRIISLSDSINKRTILRGIAESVLASIDRLFESGTPISLINIQELSKFIELICTELNDNENERDKQILTNLKKLKFWLKIQFQKNGIEYRVKTDEGESRDVQTLFSENEKTRDEAIPAELREAFLDKVTNDFFREFEVQFSKKRIESIAAFDEALAERFKVSFEAMQKLSNNLTFILLSLYLLLYPKERAQEKYAKVAHTWIAMEWQLIKKNTTTEFQELKSTNFVSYDELAKFICDYTNAPANVEVK